MKFGLCLAKEALESFGLGKTVSELGLKGVDLVLELLGGGNEFAAGVAGSRLGNGLAGFRRARGSFGRRQN